MNELLALEEGMVVFEVGTGSGYHAATIAEIVAPGDSDPSGWGHVYTSEIIPSLARRAYRNLRRAGYSDRVTVINCDGSAGLPLRVRPHRVLITAAAPRPPPPLVSQLREGGLMVLPVGPPSPWFQGQRLAVVEKTESGVEYREVLDVAFVPLRGVYGWSD